MLTDLKTNQPVSVGGNSKLAEDIFNTLKVAAKHSATPLPEKSLRICAQELAELTQIKNKNLKTKKEVKDIRENLDMAMEEMMACTSPAYYNETKKLHSWIKVSEKVIEEGLSLYPFLRRKDENMLSRVVLRHTAQITARNLGFIPIDRHLLDIVSTIIGKNYDDSWVGRNLTQEQRKNILDEAKSSTQKDIQQESNEEVGKILEEAAEREAETLIDRVSKERKSYSHAELEKKLRDLIKDHPSIYEITVKSRPNKDKNIHPIISFLRPDDMEFDSFANSNS